MKKLWLSFGLVCSIAWLSGQSSVTHVRFADEQFASGHWDLALKEYLRAYYFDYSGSDHQLLTKIARVSSLVRKDDLALEFYRKAQRAYKDDPNKLLNVYIEKSQIHLGNNQPKAALAELLSCRSNLINADSDRYYFYLSMVYLMDDDVDAGVISLQKLSYYNKLDQSFLGEIKNQLYKANNRIHKRARIMSYILPGSGQVYNGNIKDAANSVALLSGLGLIFSGVYRSLGLLDAVVSVGPFIIRYYLGGAKSAELGSRRRSARNKQIAITKLINHISAYRDVKK